MEHGEVDIIVFTKGDVDTILNGRAIQGYVADSSDVV